jgi:hypothetical protein
LLLAELFNRLQQKGKQYWILSRGREARIKVSLRNVNLLHFFETPSASYQLHLASRGMSAALGVAERAGAAGRPAAGGGGSPGDALMQSFPGGSAVDSSKGSGAAGVDAQFFTPMGRDANQQMLPSPVDGGFLPNQPTIPEEGSLVPMSDVSRGGSMVDLQQLAADPGAQEQQQSNLRIETKTSAASSAPQASPYTPFLAHQEVKNTMCPAHEKFRTVV